MEQAVQKFLAYFSNPTLAGIAIAVLFGVIWLLAYWPPMLKMKSLWLVLLGGALVTVFASAFIQVPLNGLARGLMGLIFGNGADEKVLLTGFLYVLIAGLVQEGAKLLPVVVLWLRKGKEMDPLVGLAAGAAAGVGFAVIEAQWVHNALFFNAGWSWSALGAGSYTGLLTFWERLVMVGLHTALGALMGHSLAKSRGWGGYLLAAFIHAMANFSAYLLTDGIMSYLVVEVYLTAVTAVLAVIMLSLRWEK